MSASFGAIATQFSGVAARLLGWRPDEFWRATPAELHAALTNQPNAPTPLDRPSLQRMMENENG